MTHRPKAYRVILPPVLPIFRLQVVAMVDEQTDIPSVLDLTWRMVLANDALRVEIMDSTPVPMQEDHGAVCRLSTAERTLT